MTEIKDTGARHVVYTAIGEVLVDQGQAFMFGYDFDEYLPEGASKLKLADVRDPEYAYDKEAEEILLYCLFNASSVADLGFALGFPFAPYIERYAKYLKVSHDDEGK